MSVSARSPSIDALTTRNSWARLIRGYAVFTAMTGLPCLVVAAYLHDASMIITWIELVLGLVVITGAITAVCAVTAYPLLLLLVVIFDRGHTPPHGRDSNGPGHFVCR